MSRAFEAIRVPARPPKPRERGLTMLIDWGSGQRAVEDRLEVAGPFVDLAKVAVGISGLVDREWLRRTVALYRRFGVDPFPGGMFLELAWTQGQAAAYYRECVAVGYATVEVSDNVVRFPRGAKEDLIRQAREEFGLRVLGEVGRKRQVTPVAELLAGVEAALRLGCWKVLLEAAELFDGGLRRDVLREIGRTVPADALIVELPGRWLPGVHAADVVAMMGALVDELGPDVNVGNVLPDDLLMLETIRTGVGATMRVGER